MVWFKNRLEPDFQTWTFRQQVHQTPLTPEGRLKLPFLLCKRIESVLNPDLKDWGVAPQPVNNGKNPGDGCPSQMSIDYPKTNGTH